MNGWVSRLTGVFGIVSELDQSLYVYAAFRDIKILNHRHLTLCAFHLGTPHGLWKREMTPAPYSVPISSSDALMTRSCRRQMRYALKQL
jgi:hypothetical protein